LVGRIGGQLATATRYQQRQVFTAAARAPQPPGDAGLALGRLGTWRERSGSRARASAGGVLSPISGGRRHAGALPGWPPLLLQFFFTCLSSVINQSKVKGQNRADGWLLGRSSSPPATRWKRTPDAALKSAAVSAAIKAASFQLATEPAGQPAKVSAVRCSGLRR